MRLANQPRRPFVGLLHPPDQPMPRLRRRKPLRSGGCRSVQFEGGVGELGDGEATIAGRGEKLRDPPLDPSSASAQALSVIMS